MCCRNCGSQNVIKGGFIKATQRYKYKDCHYQFVPNIHHGRS